MPGDDENCVYAIGLLQDFKLVWCARWPSQTSVDFLKSDIDAPEAAECPLQCLSISKVKACALAFVSACMKYIREKATEVVGYIIDVAKIVICC